MAATSLLVGTGVASNSLKKGHRMTQLMNPKSGKKSTPARVATTHVQTAQLVVVANRLPVRPSSAKEGDGGWRPSPGGLVTALSSVLQENDGLWIGWPGASTGESAPEIYEGIRLKSVEISTEEYEEFYLGFSNATLWPLYHDAIRAPTFHRHWWQTYRTVNRRYAEAAAQAVEPNGTVWVHDYQLQLVPQMLRELRPDVKIGFFLHIPFPPAELFMQLPWRKEILQGLLGADLIGFQVHSNASNFSRLARRQLGATGTDGTLLYQNHVTTVGAFPISVDCDQLTSLAQDPAIMRRCVELRLTLGNPQRVLLGCDRLDYTKGIQQRMKAVAELFAEGTLVPGRDVMVQVAVPSRESDSHYERERHELEQIVSEMNGEFGLVGSPVVHYLHQNLPFDELVALYLCADVMLVTPFCDGMNLVAKEYVMCRTNYDGTLVLSEFAGAAKELRGAYIVNPHDLEGVKEAIRSALSAGPKEIRARMSRMRRQILRRNVFDWANLFLGRRRHRGQL
jgi:trehalose 6-phosphate synthase